MVGQRLAPAREKVLCWIAAFSKKIDIYLGVGKQGLSPTLVPHVMEVEANLLAEKLKFSKRETVSTYFDYLPGENQATITHQVVFNAFRVVSRTGEVEILVLI
ncbi:MAG: alpha/beta hydrolase [Flaviaesturariibacter sp.]|nr:alpha/beta hydrolase [Flaviaesturariibacter sp.]